MEKTEGTGEHIKVGPGRLEAPVPFEFSRIVLPAAATTTPARASPLARASRSCCGPVRSSVVGGGTTMMLYAVRLPVPACLRARVGDAQGPCHDVTRPLGKYGEEATWRSAADCGEAVLSSYG